ncbi:MAG: hypothetical protein QXO59_10975, partial [Candidatus Jordarchaeales archaeon]
MFFFLIYFAIATTNQEAERITVKLVWLKCGPPWRTLWIIAWPFCSPCTLWRAINDLAPKVKIYFLLGYLL